MTKYNKDRAIIFNTYQCYLKNTFNNFTVDLEQTRRDQFYFAAKFVRGAYMDQERARALELGYDDPIQPDYLSTSKSYHRVADLALEYIAAGGNANVMIASHNTFTVQYITGRMDILGIPRESGNVYFGQLFGMRDHLSFPLGQAGYSAYKCIHFGPMNDVLPYLSRRCQENRSLLDGVKEERAIVKKELFRRICRFQFR